MKHCTGQEMDPFTRHVYDQIDAQVRATLTPEQETAIVQAISASQSFKKHPVDIRGTIPLYLAKLYFVFLMGRDKRSVARRKEDARRKKLALGSAILSVYVMLSCLVPIAFLFLYLIKSALGIDVFPDMHLSDILSQIISFE